MFRDPGGRLEEVQGKLIRTIEPAFAPHFNALMESSASRSFIAQGRLIPTQILQNSSPSDSLRAEHPRIFFPSFPYEWSPSMLRSAGCLTLDLAESFLDEGMGLKDATPYNILFSRGQAVFVDVLSFEKRNNHDPVWLPYAQFVRMFVLPLLLNESLALPLSSIFYVWRDGIEPETAFKSISAFKKMQPKFLQYATFPALLKKWTHNPDERIYRKKTMDDPEKSRFILKSLFRHLKKRDSILAPHRL